VDRGWIKGFVSSRFVPFQQCFRPSYVDMASGQRGSSVPGWIEGGGVVVRSAIPGKEENTENGDAGRPGRGDKTRAQYAGSTSWTRHAAQ